jgi:UPF0755 protein
VAGVRRGVAIAFVVVLFAATAAAATGPQLKIVFPEGYTVRKMADRVSAVRVIAIRKRHITPVLTGTAYAAAAAVTRPPAAFTADDKRHSIEGFLFPSTYVFGASTTASQLIALQLQAFAAEWRHVDVAAARAHHVTPYGLLTIASMVERETVVPSERKLVAAVIYNRLAKGMPLGIDATLRYGLGIPGNRSITVAELHNPTPYNTDLHEGLPPTPIGNPGLPSLLAAAHPAAVDYLYYLRKPHSDHHFFTASGRVFCTKAQQWGYRC